MTQNRNSNQSSSNQSQRDDARAQKVASEAQQQTKAKRGDVAASTHGGKTDPAQIIADDAQDTVDRMKQMAESGRIEGGAFAGERNDDDEESDLGILDAAEDDAPLSEKGGADFGNSG